ADFDGDGDADILFQFSGFPNDWQFYRNDGTDGTGNPTFTLLDKEDADSPIKGLNMVNMSSQNYRVGDFDGDGDLDMFASSLNVAGSVYWQSGSSPKLISATPADDTLNVSPGANIVLTFDRSVNPGSGSIQLVRLSDGQVTTIAASSVEVSGSGTTWTINPASNLDQGAAYAVRISPKAFVSTDGKAYEGIANNTALNFNTSSVQAPVISNLNGDSVTFTEGTPGTLLDAGSNASVTDADSLNFNGGNVTVTISNGQASQDVLWINTDGNGAGSISTSGNDVLYGGVVIGTYAGGTLGNPLVISLNSAATPAAVSGLLRNLSYRNTDLDNPNTAARTVQITVNDGAGGTSSVASVQVNVTAVNDAP
ncbi:Ig-like domain-containing protein, partial [Pseudomonas laurentiana]|nr:Ig-like domain-containing protein [Pseudomonas laurentiana]